MVHEIVRKKAKSTKFVFQFLFSDFQGSQPLVYIYMAIDNYFFASLT